MRKLLTVLFILVTSAVYSQSKALVHINAEFNKSNDWYGLEAVDNVKLFGGYVDKTPGIKDKYKITRVPTLILYVDGKEVERWEAGLDMKLHVTTKEVQSKIDNN